MTSILSDPIESPSISIAGRLRAIVVLLRPQQYYKNLLVFFGLFFSKSLFRLDLWLPTFLAFIALCLVSSLNYLINDFRDKEQDRHHPEKCNRPFPSGKVSSPLGLLIGFFLILLLLLLLVIINFYRISLYSPPPQEEETLQYAELSIESITAFILVLGGLFITSQFYSLFIRRYVFADIVTISVNYVWRAIAGAVLISVSVSPWLIILCFITAMMLSLAKRKGDLAVLGEQASHHKPVFKMYTPQLLDQSLTTISAIELLAIFIYLVERHPNETVFIVLALPLITFCIFRYLFLVSSNSVVSRRAEHLFLDKQILLIGVIIVLLFFIAIYFPNLLDSLMRIPDPKLS